MRDVARRGLILALAVAALILLAMLTAPPASAAEEDTADEVMFYREDGLFRFYNIESDAELPSPMLAGDKYTTGWTSILAIDLDGKGQDEMFFYREDGLFRFYQIRRDGSLPTPILEGDGYTRGWTAITAVDLDGDGQDEMFFYRDDGVYRYYNIGSDGRIGSPILEGTDYSPGWSAITAIDLDGDRRDEMFFYRDDGVYRFYNVRSDGSLGQPLTEGSNYTPGWSSISSIDLDGDFEDELLFYRDDGLYRYYPVSSRGVLGSPIQAGDDYTAGWSSISAVELHGDHSVERVARFTTFFDCCQNRVTNIRLIASEVNGTVVLPGETFSIDEITGPRTSSGGYLPAPYLVDGEGRCCAYGGGISQFGTTIHNAVFWGGFDVVSHKPHSAWIDRYPLGIEATLVYSSIDYRFRNDTVTPVTIRTSSTGTSVTVELWGYQGGWQMTGFHPRGNRSSNITVVDVGTSDAKRVGGQVFGSAPGRVRIVRTLTQGGTSWSETWFWTYVD